MSSSELRMFFSIAARRSGSGSRSISISCQDSSFAPGRRIFEEDLLEPAEAVADDGKNRMCEQVHRESVLRAHHAERIDEERHVVGDDHDDRVRGREAIACRIRIEHAHQRAAALPPAPELELGERCARKVVRRALHEIELGNAMVEIAREPIGRDRHPAATRAARACGDAVDDCLTCGWDSA